VLLVQLLPLLLRRRRRRRHRPIERAWRRNLPEAGSGRRRHGGSPRAALLRRLRLGGSVHQRPPTRLARLLRGVLRSMLRDRLGACRPLPRLIRLACNPFRMEALIELAAQFTADERIPRHVCAFV
jgi:hypothetical protein